MERAQENPDRAKNQSDCRIRYRALVEKNKLLLSSVRLALFKTEVCHLCIKRFFNDHTNAIMLGGRLPETENT